MRLAGPITYLLVRAPGRDSGGGPGRLASCLVPDPSESQQAQCWESEADPWPRHTSINRHAQKIQSAMAARIVIKLTKTQDPRNPPNVGRVSCLSSQGPRGLVPLLVFLVYSPPAACGRHDVKLSCLGAPLPFRSEIGVHAISALSKNYAPTATKKAVMIPKTTHVILVDRFIRRLPPRPNGEPTYDPGVERNTRARCT